MSAAECDNAKSIDEKAGMYILWDVKVAKHVTD